MDHNEAIELKAAERYVLCELPEELREAYEEHFFDCLECAAHIQAATIFAATTHDVFAEDPSVPSVRSNGRVSLWQRLLRPLVVAPTFAALALALVVGYEFQRASLKPTEIAAVMSSIKLLGDERRGPADPPVVRVRPRESFALNFDFLPSAKFDSYLGELRDAAGHTVLPVKLAGDTATHEVNVVVPGGLVRPGKYILAFFGASAPPNLAPPQQRVESFTFLVEFTP